MQPALFAVMVSLAELWRSHGVEPAAVLGHSQGEIAAAHVAGALSLEDAARVVALRSQALLELAGKGGMLSVHLPAAEALPLIEPWGEDLGVAAENSPLSTVVSGDPKALEELVARCEADGIRTRMVAVDYASHSHQVESIRERLAADLAPIEARRAEVPFYSALTGELLDGSELGADYWYRSLREPVRFAAATAALLDHGLDVLVEVSAHPVLATAVEESIAEAGVTAAAVGSLRRDRGGLDQMATALAAAHVAGAAVDWASFFAPAQPRRVALPTYAFQRRRFWLESSGRGGAGAAAIGQGDAEHPLLGAFTSVPGERGWLLSGRLSLGAHPWLVDHALFETTILPGTAFVEMALRAAELAGMEAIEELTLEAPLALPEQGAVQVQVSVGESAEDGSRAIEIHSRPEDRDDPDPEWARNASGTLAAAAPAEPEPLGEWPPPGAEPIGLEDFYERAAELGIDYGPAFQGVKAAWRQGPALYTEIELGEEQAPEAERFGVHPALLDAAFHSQLLALADRPEPLVPFGARGVRLSAAGAQRLRVRLAPSPADSDSLALLATDPAGETAIAIEALLARPIAPERLAPAGAGSDSLFALEWRSLALPEAIEEEAAEVRRHKCVPDPALDPPAAALELCAEVLATVQEAIAEEAAPRIAFLTRGALAAAPGESPDPAAAALWGLVRSAQAEHPGRFALIDSDGGEASEAALAAALAFEEEPQIALREGLASVPRLARVPAPEAEAPPFDPERTILLTGATGTLGMLFARHLAATYGARHLLLASRRGAAAPGAAELLAELSELGAQAEILAADVGERDQLEALLGAVDPAHPLGAVFHIAGTTDDAMVDSLDRERLATTMGPKANAAWHLHELTREIEGCELVLFSSVAGTLQNPGQGNYAAANAFLDALASQRRAEGLAGSSLGWGGWAELSELTAQVAKADGARLARSGVVPFSSEEGLELYDRARALGEAQLLPVRLQSAALRTAAREGTLAPLLSGLVRVPVRRAQGGSLAARLEGKPEDERRALALELVLGHVAAVLGHSSATAIDPAAAFKDLGFDSLIAVELRNRLAQASGLRLPATLVFDYPSAEAVAGFLLAEVGGTRAATVVRAAARVEEPIAIVGMSCRFPGGVRSPEQLWELVASGTDAITPFPANRGWELDRLYHPDPDHIGTSNVREGGFLAAGDEFDAGFFAISPREARLMDPQQRLLLEAAWEAFEDAGIDPTSLAGSDAGVFTGLMYHDYGVGGPDSAEMGGHGGSAAAGSIASGHVAYSFGLEGPAVTVDTACSSALVAMHLAAQALRGGECGLALAGGSTVLATPSCLVEFSHQRALAPDGRSKSFAAAADGVALGEGVGLLLLERLSDAERNGHEVLALIKGSATNQDGASNGLTAPNGPSQERVIRQALANAGLEPGEVDAVEAHGTGTTLGDPIEAQALLATYGQDRGDAGPLALGSIKSNIGHTQAAAGVAGVMKMVLAMRQGVLPQTLHVDEPTPHVDWSAGEVELLTEAREWEGGDKPRRAGISSFGMSGTNAHVIVEEAPRSKAEGEDVERQPLPATPIVLSAKGAEALRETAGQLAARLRADAELDPTDAAFTLATARAVLSDRAAIVASDGEQLLAGLDALVADEPHSAVVEGKARSGKLAFLLSGQGAQRAEMGKQLYASYPTFATALDEIFAELDTHLDRPLKELLFAEAGSEDAALLDRTQFTQPALFAIEVALFRLLQSWGLKPDFLVGHSIGELAAAHISGVLDLADACKLIAARGALMGALPEGGAMVAIEASEEELLEDLPEGLSIAAINSPTSVVVSGEEKAALDLQSTWEEKGRKTSRLTVSHAFHSELMEPMLQDFEGVAKSLTYSDPQIPICSNVTGEMLSAEQATSPAYWAAQVRQPVRFAQGVEQLAEAGVTTFLELGPDGVLSAMARATLASADEPPTVAPLLRRERPEASTLISALAAAHVAGAAVDWASFFAPAQPRRVALPTYAFQRRRFWLESSGRGGAGAAAIGQGDAEHPLLGAFTSVPGERGWLLSGRLSLGAHPWLVDHALFETTILPGTAFVEMALRAAELAGMEAIEELTLEAPLALPEQGAVQVQVSVGESAEDGSRAIEIHSRPEDRDDPDPEWARNASGTLAAAAPAEPEPLGEWPPPGAEPIGLEDFYERAAELGIDYGPAFQGVKAAWRQGPALYTEIELGEEQAPEAERFGVHPALLDAAFHSQLLALADRPEPLVPFGARGVRLSAAGAQRLRVRLAPSPADSDSLALLATDPAGETAIAIEALLARPIAPERLAPAGAGSDSLFALEWRSLALPEAIEEEAAEVRRHKCVPDPALDPPAAALELCAEVLATVQEAIAEEAAPRIAFLTRGALAAAPGESPDPAAAALWGLVRSAQAEHPGRFALIDSDGGEASEAALAAALAFEEEPQIALREGLASVPRLARVPAPEAEAPPFDPERTILLTGATGTLGMLFARHLAATYGARHLLLASRRGAAAPGAAELLAELSELGAQAEILAADVGERDQLEALLGAIDPAHPLGAVFHIAGTTDDAMVDSLDRERLATTMGPKANAAWHLHELTREIEGCELVLFSSVAGTLQNPGQGNYAAANAFLDALASQRRAEGLAGSSLGWGGWAELSELTAQVAKADGARLARSGVVPFSSEEGLELYDRARALGEAQLLPVRLQSAALRTAAREGTLAPLLSGLVRVPVRRAQGGSLAARLEGKPEDERRALALELVLGHVAAVLGHSSATAIDPAAAFKDLGFDSLIAVELRNRLAQASGLRLPATLVFDYPSAEAVAGFLLAEVGGTRAATVVRAAARVEEPIAIVGMSCRFPGGVRSPEQLWELVASGTDAITPFPANRGWELDRLYHPDPDHIGTSNVREAGFLHDAAQFDAPFFGVSPREARVMDPQQRLLLEAAWEAFEDAGIDPTSLAGSDAGVFTGLMHHDYGLGGTGGSEIGGLQGAVSAGSIVSGHLAYFFGLEGPALTVDTACSSSLVSMHLAAQALRGGECGLALAGGSTVMGTPGLFIEFSHQRGLAIDGRSKSFAATADGAGFSEGVGLLLLERLSDAERNGHEVLALIRGSATNQDGASNGLSAPNGPSQERVIMQALANAGLEPGEVDAVEAHGTGTTLGDPIEAQALLATYGQDRGDAGPLALGSIKSNIGHTQAAAGVAGVMKMVLAMRQGVLPQTLHVDEPTPHVDWSAGEVELLTEAREWEDAGRPRRAGVSSFGMSGTNAHVIVEEAPKVEVVESEDSEEGDGEPRAQLPAIPILLSAKGTEALREQAARLAAHLREDSELEGSDVGFTLATARAALGDRAAIVATEREQLLAGLDALAADEPHAAIVEGKAKTGKLAFLLSGQGAQRAEMGKELYASFPVFATALDEICAELDTHLERPLKDLLFAEPGSEDAALLDRTQYTQPALFAIEVALYRLLQSWGVKPDFLIGHSIGELAAAHISGVLDLADACKLIAARGALMGALPEGGAMVAIEASEEEVLEDLPEGLSIAAINSPTSAVVSGEEQAAHELEASWKDKGRKTSRLTVSHAFHSELMEPMLQDFEGVAKSLTYSDPQIPICSNVTGEMLSAEQATSPAYWAAQVRQPVRFAQGVEQLAEQGVTTFLELGPDGILSAMAKATLAAAASAEQTALQGLGPHRGQRAGASAEQTGAETPPTVAPLLRRERPEAQTLVSALAAAHVAGAAVDWASFFAPAQPRRVALPTYAFQRRRYWVGGATAGGGDVRAAGLAAAEHPLLVAAVPLPDGDGLLLTGRLSRQSHAWIGDHGLLGNAILPGTAFVEMALAAAERVGAEAIEELTLEAPLALPEQGAVQVQVHIGEADEDGSRPLAIRSRPDSADDPDLEWTRNASGSLGRVEVESAASGEWPPAGAEPVELEGFYERLAELGLQYGPAFQGLKAAWRLGDEVFAEVGLAAEQGPEAERFGIHPALLDAALHPALLDAAEGSAGEPAAGGIQVPFSWSGVRLAAGGSAEMRVRMTSAAGSMGLELADATGVPLATVRSLALRTIDPAQLRAGAARSDSLFALEWQQLALPEAIEEEAAEVRRHECVPDPALDPPAAALELCAEVLATVQEAIAEEAAPRIAFLTRGALAAAPGESPDPAAAALWGLVRSAQAEHPGRFALIDSDGGEASEAALAAALALAWGEEPQIALREGVATAPRLARAPAPAGEPRALDPTGTVLVTGGTGFLGGLFARHLAERHGIRHLVLTSRRGAEAPGAAELLAELSQLGAQAEAVACDAGDRDQLEALLAAIPAERPLTAVLHCAGVTDDGVIDSLDRERLATTMGPKANAAWHLHELTREIEGCELVLFSSVAGTLQNPGQGNYAAANAFLDALASQRRAEGLAGSSLGWGGWLQLSDVVADLTEADKMRLSRGGIVPFEVAEGVELFERARALGAPQLLPVRLDLGALRDAAHAGTMAPLFSGLVRVPARRGGAGSLAKRLADVPAGDREGLVLELVRGHVAAVLGHPGADAVDPALAFKDLGFDSLAAVELRNRLDRATGLRLPATLVFDYPNAEAVAGFLLAEVGGTRAATVVRARTRVEEPIAIVGMSCRYPGGVESPQELWELVAAGTDAVSGFPENRGWDLERLYHPDPDHLGTTISREGGFLHHAAEFDAGFFGIGAHEAMVTDPQGRLLLEATWEVFEAAGLDPAALAGTDTGVFTGLMHHDYGQGGSGSSALGGQAGSVAAGSFVSGSVAYAFGLEGPALTVDTACSSSLVAMHLAAQALRGGECGLALAGGSTVMATPGLLIELSRQRALSTDGRCRSFAGGADGTGFSEGVGLLLLERLSDAERNGHEVLALIKGSATNQDGASNGLTAPNGPSQERVIMQALANAGLEPGEVDAVEAHGTGTTLGDPIEAQAILATYGQDREKPLALGSIKSNLGHTQAAAGVAGVIKMAMAMRQGVLPQTLHVDEPTPHVDWSAGAVELLTEPRDWDAGDRPRRAGVSSFGMSGTNAHVILEEAPAVAAPVPVEAGEGRVAPAVVPWLVSARSEEALRGQAERLVSRLREDAELEPVDVGLTLATRPPHDYRAAIVATEREQLLAGLDALAADEPHAAIVEGKAKTGKLAFLLSGQGAQRAEMGKELYESYPAFATALDELCAELDTHLERPLKDPLFAEPGSEDAALLDRTQYTQPALFAIEVALFRLLQSWGLKPDFLVGHSIGELAAAHISGVLNLADACKLISARGALMGALPEGGAMVAIEASEQEVLEDLPEGLSIAAINSPTSVVVSGEEDAALQLQESWKEKERKTSRLTVSHAFHSELMEPMLAEFETVASSLTYSEPTIPIVSNVSGEPLTPEQATSPAYWAAQVRQPVRFAQGVEQLAEQGVTTFLELGPDGILSAMAKATLAAAASAEQTALQGLGPHRGQRAGASAEQTGAETPPTVAPLLRRERPEAQTLVSALAAAHVAGAAVDWASFFAPAAPKRVALPTYAFQRQPFWAGGGAATGDVAAAGQSAAEHPLLGAVIPLPKEEGWLLTGRISPRTHPWLAEHMVMGASMLPGTAFVEMALKAAEQSGGAEVEELTIEAPLVFADAAAVQLQVSVGAADEEGRRPLSIHSRPETVEGPGAEWLRNASGALIPELDGADAVEGLVQWPPAGAEPVAVEGFYERVAEVGIEYGAAFRGMRAAWRRGDDVFAEIELPAEQVQEAARFAIHPALLDAALHPAMLGGAGVEGLPVPFSWSGIRLLGTGTGALRVQLSSEEGGFSLLLADPSGIPLGSIRSLAVRPIDLAQLQAQAATPGDSLFALEWRRLILPEQPAAEVRLVECAAPAGGDRAAAAQALCAEVLATLQEAIAADEGDAAPARIAFVTHGAVATREDEVADPAAAAAWGLVRSAQVEHPERFVLVDSDGEEASEAAVAIAAASEEEMQIALREGLALAPRLARAGEPEGEAPPLGGEGTVLITGGTGTLGALFARHLASAHGARHLILSSRRGPEAPGVAELVAELAELGADAEVVAGDAGDRAQLEELLAAIPAERPLTAVLHAAGVTDDGVIDSLDPERLATVLAPKAGAAWHLHELTRELPGCELVLFSSFAAAVGNPGQGNYAAANSFLDALAAQRRSEGLAGISLGWGGWEQESELSAGDGEGDRSRLARAGARAFSDAEGLELFDRARALDQAHLLPVGLDLAALRAAAGAGMLLPLFAGLVRMPARRAQRGSLAERLAGIAAEEREAVVVELVRTHVAAALGQPSAAAVGPAVPFKDLGFDSLAAVELRNRLEQVTGLRLPATLVFDYPSCQDVAGYLLAQVEGSGNADLQVDAALDGLRSLLESLAAEEREGAEARLRALLAEGQETSDAEADAVERIESASAEELLQIVDEEIGAT